MLAVQYWAFLVDKTEFKCSFTVSIDAQCVVVSPKVFKDVAASGDLCAVGLALLRSNIDCITWVCYPLSVWYLVFEYSIKDVDPFSVSISLEQSRKLINPRDIPSFCNFAVGMFHELAPGCKFL